MPTSRDPEEAALDPVGAVLSIVGIVALVYGLIQAPSSGWTSTSTLGAFALAIVVLLLFVAWELHVDEPMLDMHYFKNPAFSTGTGGMILVFLSMYGVIFLVTQYFQLVQRLQPAVGGVAHPADRVDHDRRVAVHAAPLGAGSARTGRSAFGMFSISIAFALLAHARRAQPVRVHGRVLHPAHRRDRAHDVADDGVDHVGRARAPRGRRLGDERRDA